ncbi:hypothetical protein WN944_029052 [Citrus x changshan-huyou]|uniref:Uncharacterized protein n=1 Tax=Citrus x changshan-huyou TaxID=2935761 RepID=A0AAP0QAQ9_9ROSI
MANMMGMESRLGPEGADIGANIGKILGMDLGFISFIPQMFMQVSGLMGKVMDVEFILVRMGVDMLANLSGGSSTALAIAISGNAYESFSSHIDIQVSYLEMGTHMLENILRTRCMDSASIVLPMGIGMEESGMREARQAAEKAYDVARIDEKVNRAVAAANNAVNAARVAVFKAVQKQMHHSNSKDSIPLAIV